ncbi:MAG: phosphopantetheine-binding protein [Rhodospirillaceae bacterium]
MTADQPTGASIKGAVRAFLGRHIRDADVIADDQDLFGSGLVNSLFAMQLVMFVEQDYETTVGNEDLDIENFRSINAISALIARKTGASDPA